MSVTAQRLRLQGENTFIKRLGLRLQGEITFIKRLGDIVPVLESSKNFSDPSS